MGHIRPGGPASRRRLPPVPSASSTSPVQEGSIEVCHCESCTARPGPSLAVAGGAVEVALSSGCICQDKRKQDVLARPAGDGGSTHCDGTGSVPHWPDFLQQSPAGCQEMMPDHLASRQPTQAAYYKGQPTALGIPNRPCCKKQASNAQLAASMQGWLLRSGCSLLHLWIFDAVGACNTAYACINVSMQHDWLSERLLPARQAGQHQAPGQASA
jgi:hypothetical protein